MISEALKARNMPCSLAIANYTPITLRTFSAPLTETWNLKPT